MAKFDPASWAAKNRGTFNVACRLIDGTDYDFTFRILTGEAALEVKRQVYDLEKSTRRLLKEDKQKDLDQRDVEVSVELTKIDTKTLRVLTRACLDTEGMDDDGVDQLIVAAGGLNSPFGEAVFRACGINHPKEVVRLMKPDIFGDLPFLSRGKRGKTTG